MTENKNVLNMSLNEKKSNKIILFHLANTFFPAISSLEIIIIYLLKKGIQ